MIQLRHIFFVGIVFASGCSIEYGFKIFIQPNNAITNDCFIKSVQSLSPEIEYFGSNTKDKYTHFNFKMSEDFHNKLVSLGVPEMSGYAGKIDSWFRFENNQLTDIKFGWLYNNARLDNNISKVQQDTFLEFIKPYIVSIKSLPARLNENCSLVADDSNINFRCVGSLCEKL